MNTRSHRTLWATIGLANALLLLGGGVLFSTIAYKNLLVLLLGVAGVSMLLTTLWRMHRQSSQLVTSLQRLARGEVDCSLSDAEETPGVQSINLLHHKLQETADFVETLKETETTHELKFVRPDERLGKSLLAVKSTFREYRENDEKRHWSSQGLAHFADILRSHLDSTEAFSDQVIRQLVKYLGVNQGGIFVKTEVDGDTWFELTACYAYDRKKYVKKRWAPGEGLVGQCALEQQTILLTNVPDQYTTITSGLGEATPSTLVIVPLRWNEEVYGVIELASFKELPPHQISFVEKVAESIASSLSTVQTSAHMHQLLQTSQQLTQEFEQLSLVANNTDNSVVITDQLGQIEFVNQGFTNLTGYTTHEVMGKTPGQVLQGPDTDPKTVERIRRKLMEGNSFYEEILNYRKSGESYWISLTINPIKDETGKTRQFISVQADVTQIKQQTLDYTYKLEAISRSNAIVEFSPEGTIADANDLFLDIAGYQREDLVGRAYAYLLPEEEVKSPQTQMMWDSLRGGNFFSGEFKQKSKQGKELWLSGTFNPIFDLGGTLRKVMMFAQFTTHEKEKQNDLAGIVQAFTETLPTFDMTPDGALKKANALFLDRFGYKRREISHLKLTDLLEANCQLPDVGPTLQQQNNVQLPLTLLTKSGEKVWCQCSFTGIKNLENVLSKVMVVALENYA